MDASGLPDTPEVGAEMTVRAAVQLAGLNPADVAVEAVVGRVGETDDLADTVTVPMEHVGQADGDGDRFEAVVKLPHAGLTGYTVRVLPAHPLLASAGGAGQGRAGRLTDAPWWWSGSSRSPPRRARGCSIRE